MADYIDILVTKDGYFCAAPPWEIKEGDLVCISHDNAGVSHEVLSVATDSKDGPFVKMIENYIGYPLPRVTAKYHKSEVTWDEAVQE